MSQGSFDFASKLLPVDDDYIISESNNNAYSLINKWPDWDSNILLLYGPKSCGKTHLSKIWANNASASFIKAEDIYSNNFDLARNYILDDLEKVNDEPALLHFYNMVKEANTGYLVMTASNNPVNIGIRLADLRSRIGAVPSVGISDPDNIILCQMLVKKFAQRQLKVDIEVIKYIVTRMERSFNAVDSIVDILDNKALQDKKNITIPFVKTVLDK